jgi:hypothetical protein
MEEIEISSWLTLDALKQAGEIKETLGNLQTEHNMSIFCKIEDDYLELCYSDTASNYIRHYDDKEEFMIAIEKRREEVGEAPYEEDLNYEESYEEEGSEDEFGFEKE